MTQTRLVRSRLGHDSDTTRTRLGHDSDTTRTQSSRAPPGHPPTDHLRRRRTWTTAAPCRHAAPPPEQPGGAPREPRRTVQGHGHDPDAILENATGPLGRRRSTSAGVRRISGVVCGTRAAEPPMAVSLMPRRSMCGFSWAPHIGRGPPCIGAWLRRKRRARLCDL